MVLRFDRRELLRGAGSGLAGLALFPELRGRSILGDPDRARRLALLPSRWVTVPAGPFLMGTTPQQVQALADLHGYHPTWMDGEVPQRTVDLPAFSIQRFPVTHRDFAAFCAATGYPPRLNWVYGVPPVGLLDHPVNFVTRADALAYAAWIGRRLPTEAEWEKAARGVDGRTFPWGDAFDPSACRWNADPLSPGPGTAPVGSHPLGASPYGVHDMSGNVAEWCADGPSPYSAYIKGGSWVTGEILNLRPASRTQSGALDNPHRFYGFRCARDLP